MKLPFNLELTRITNRHPVLGINSNLELEEGAEWWEHHILMLDYDDNLSLDALKRELQRLQETYALGTAQLWRSSHSRYFVLFPRNVMTYWECLQVIHDTPCDPAFKRVRMVYQYMTLRVSLKHDAKPELVEVISNHGADTVKYLTHCKRFEQAFVEATRAW